MQIGMTCTIIRAIFVHNIRTYTHTNTHIPALSEVSLLASILRESPSQLLGRLVFKVGISPKRLEQFMVAFPHMHMMEVLIKCCCPWLPAHTAVLHAPGE